MWDRQKEGHLGPFLPGKGDQRETETRAEGGSPSQNFPEGELGKEDGTDQRSLRGRNYA